MEDGHQTRLNIIVQPSRRPRLCPCLNINSQTDICSFKNRRTKSLCI